MAGVEFDIKKDTQRKGIEPTQVKSIKLLTPLEKGSDNDGTGKNFNQDGAVFGKTYKFRVDTYTHLPPKDKKKIKWKFKYHSLSKNKWIEYNSSKTGEEYSLYLNEKDICGRTIHVMAYINDEESEGYLTVWHHNRFRFFDRQLIENQAKERAKDPWKVDQSASSLCGMASLYNVLIKKDPKLYLRIAKELHRTGESIVKSFTIKPHEKALGMYDMDPRSSDFRTISMPIADWLVLATTRSREAYLFNNLVYRGVEKGDRDMLSAVNWPEMMTKMAKDVASYTNANAIGLSKVLIQQKKRPIGAKLYDKFSDSDLQHLVDMQKKHDQGHKILMMIDSNMIENVTSYSYSDVLYNSHWVVYEGGLAFFDKNNNITKDISEAEKLTFRIYTWGYNPNNSYSNEVGETPAPKYILLNAKHNYKISANCFKSTFYGYIEAY